MPSYRSGSLLRALVLSLVAQVEARHNHHGLNARHADVDPSTCACGMPGATSPAAVTVTETHTVTAPTVTVTTQAPGGPGNHAGGGDTTTALGGSSSQPPAAVPTVQTVTITAPAVVVTETRTLYVTGGSTIPASTVIVTATATASPSVTTATVVQTLPPRTVFVSGTNTIIPTVITVTATPTGYPASPVTITTSTAQETDYDPSEPTGTSTSSIVAPADHHCHKNGTCHNHPGGGGASYSVTQIDLPTYCGLSTVMETVYNTVTQTVYPGGGSNSTMPMGTGTGSASMPVHTVVPPRLRDARFEDMRGHYY